MNTIPMAPETLAMLLGGVSLMFALIALWVFWRLSPKSAKRDSSQSSHESIQPETVDAQGMAMNTNAPAQQGTSKKARPKSEQCVFVIYDHPSEAINDEVGAVLSSLNAFYEADLGRYHVPPGKQGYPLMVASATSPGLLPPVHKEHGHSPIKGVSILIRFLNMQKATRRPDDFNDLIKTLAAISASQILGTNGEPISEEERMSIYE